MNSFNIDNGLPFDESGFAGTAIADENQLELGDISIVGRGFGHVEGRLFIKEYPTKKDKQIC